MKITKRQLRQIIKEEKANYIREGRYSDEDEGFAGPSESQIDQEVAMAIEEIENSIIRALDMGASSEVIMEAVRDLLMVL